MRVVAGFVQAEDVIAKLGEGVKAYLSAKGKPGEKDAADLDLVSLLGSVKGLDLPGFGRDLKGALAGLNMPDLTRSILAYTLRDGKPLDKGVHFSDAYAGNYAEMGMAVWKVAAINRFFGPLSTFVPGGA